MHAGSRPPARCRAARGGHACAGLACAGLPRANFSRNSFARDGLARPSLPGHLLVAWPRGQLCPGSERTGLARPIITGLASDGRWPSIAKHRLACVWLDVVTSLVATSVTYCCGSSPSYTQSGWRLSSKEAH